MTEFFATRSAHADAAHIGPVRFIETLAREAHHAFEVLARNQYDAPWQRVAEPGRHRS